MLCTCRSAVNFCGTHDFYRAMRMAENSFRDTPDQGFVQAFLAVRAHHDQISMPTCSVVNDRGLRITFFYIRIHRETRLT